MIALIDGDIVVYRAAFAAQKTRLCVENYNTESIDYLPEGLTKTEVRQYLDEYREEYLEGYSIYPVVTTEPLSHALHNAAKVIDTIMEKTGAHRYELYLTGSDGEPNFRKALATIAPYKANRPEKPVYYKQVREYLILHKGAKLVVGQEADDALGIQQCARPDTLICSVDKDLRMIPGKHYDIVKQTTFQVSEFTGLMNFYTQMLVGDTTDNIPGIRGIGPIRAAKILMGSTCEQDMYEKVKNVYISKGREQDILEIGRLLWIRRKEGELWEPPAEKPSL